MRVLRPATLGVALALGASGVHAQSVISRQIAPEPVETTVVQGPDGTVITRRPLAAPAAPVAPLAAPAVTDRVRVGTASYMETVGVAPVRHASRSVTSVERVHRTTTRETIGAAVTPHHVTHTRVTRSVRSVAVARPLALAAAQRRVIYRTIVQQQVIPRVAATAVPAPPPGYPAYPAPAYAERNVVVAPATTGYARAAYPVTAPAAEYDEDVYAEPVPPAVVPARYVVGSRLPAGVALAPLPVGAAVAVPAARAYSYAMIGDRVLLVDPVSYTVVADITP